MSKDELLLAISRGRTDLIFQLMKEAQWNEILNQGLVKPLQWLVYYNDTTALRAVLENGGDLTSISLNQELGNAAFFGHWKVCDFLIENGADVNGIIDKNTGETPLHNALCKAGRPYFIYTVRLLLERGADVNAKTIPGMETGAFMRNVKTKGETPLHRAAAYADADTIRLLIDHGAHVAAKDINDITPIGWASEHLRPGEILSLLSHGNYSIGPGHIIKNKSDHGHTWGNSMDWNLIGDYLPFSIASK